MTDRERPDERRPVVAGLVALVGVGVVVGLIAALATLAGARVLGLGGDEEVSADRPEQSMYLPRPQKTTASEGPLITLAAEPSETSEDEDEESKPEKPEKSKKEEDTISLSASQTEVAPMQQIDLTGVYPGGEGAILQVQRFTTGSWQDFPVTVSVSDETFSTYVQTSQGGVNRFRVVDTDSDVMSNEVRVKVG